MPVRRGWVRSGRSCKDTCLFWKRWRVRDSDGVVLVRFCAGVYVMCVCEGFRDFVLDLGSDVIIKETVMIKWCKWE